MNTNTRVDQLEAFGFAGVPTVGVARVDGAFRVIAAADIQGGERVLSIDGERVGRASRFSVQVGVDEHIDLPRELSPRTDLDRHLWRFLNHSCDPSAMLRGLDLIAVRSIRAWDEVTFDYTTTEYDLAEPFACRCGALDCLGEVRGYRHLTAARRRRIAARVAPHLLELSSPARGSRTG